MDSAFRGGKQKQNYDWLCLLPTYLCVCVFVSLRSVHSVMLTPWKAGTILYIHRRTSSRLGQEHGCTGMVDRGAHCSDICMYVDSR